MSRPFLIASGGTGGHMFPAMALARALQDRGAAVHLVCDRRGARYLDGSLPHSVIRAASPSGGMWARLTGLAALAAGTGQVLGQTLSRRPQAIAAFGGYASAPAVAAAALTGTPLMVHEQNAVLGKVNRSLAKRARVLALTFADTERVPESLRPKLRVVGNPVRPAIAAVRAAPYPVFDGKLRVLVLGGSQGARVLSDVWPAALALLAADERARLSLVQQCRPEDLERVRAAYDRLGVEAELAAFFDDVPARIAACHVMVSRSGASTVAELMAIGRPALLVPFAAAADDHQRANAERLVARLAAEMVLQPAFTGEVLADRLRAWLQVPAVLADMAAHARAMALDDAAERMAETLAELAGRTAAQSQSLGVSA